MASQTRTVLVTGASKGIGLAVTRLLLNKFHANVVAISRSSTPELDALKSEALLHIKCDVTDEQGFNSAVSAAADVYGSIDGLILNAGILGPLGRIGDDLPVSAWKKHFDVNFFSLVIAINATLPFLRKSSGGGKVVFISSGTALGGNVGSAPYNAGKASMNSLCRTLAMEEPGIVSVALAPGMVDTDMQLDLRQTGAPYLSQADYEMFVRAHTEGKLVKPEDCGHVIAGLALEAPAELSGSFIAWDWEECNPFRSV